MSDQHRRPAHQNSFGFRHNKNSKLTKKIASLPIVGLCQRCHDQIEWKKKYRKYKPLSAPSKCAWCLQKTVKAAYHTVCAPCASAKNVCEKCLKQEEILPPSHLTHEQEEAERRKLEEALSQLRERERRKILREAAKGDGGGGASNSNIDSLLEKAKKSRKAGGENGDGICSGDEDDDDGEDDDDFGSDEDFDDD